MNETTQSTRKATVAPGHLHYLDGLRALAAVYVVMVHEQLTVLPSDPLLKRLLNYPFWHGHYAVNLFIVLSGFCLMLPVIQNGGRLRGGTGRFLARRAQRILPPYYLSVAVSLALIATLIGRKTGSHWDVTLPVTPVDVAAHLLLIHDVFNSTALKINGPLWSIAVEWRIYLLFPLLLLAWRRWGGPTTTLLVVLLSVAEWVWLEQADLPNVNTTKTGLCPHYLGLFMMGALAAQVSFGTEAFYARLRNHLPWRGLLGLATLLLVVVTYYKAWFPWPYADVVMGLWSGLLLITVSVGRAERLRRLLSWPPLAFVGTFSFSIYLIHYPLNQLLLQYIVWPLGLGAVAATLFLQVIGTPLLVLGAYGFYWVAERPFVPMSRSAQAATVPEKVAVGPEAVRAQ